MKPQSEPIPSAPFLPCDFSLMKLVYVLEQRFAITPDGHAWTRTGYALPFWSRYLSVFEHVTVVARAQAVSETPSGWRRVTGPAVAFSAIPYYVGPFQYLRVRRQVDRAIKNALSTDSAVILRSPGPLAFRAAAHLLRVGHPYAAEIVGDPLDVFAPGASSSRLRVVFRRTFSRAQRRLCCGAGVVAYVTREALQKRYPTASPTFSVSDVELPDEAFRESARDYANRQGALRLLSIGSLETPYKGVDILLRALATAREAYLLTVVGEGKQRAGLEQLAADLQLSEVVSFRDEVPAGDAVRRYLDDSDALVMPSRTEGLPRIMLEAMARGLPCVGSCVGGIPELLEPEYLVEPGDVGGLSRTLDLLAAHPSKLTSASETNLATARLYRDVALQPCRMEFFRVAARLAE